MKEYRIVHYFKLDPYALLVCAIIVLSALLRIVLISQNYPLTNSDEGTMGLMALHIAYDGQFPAFLYGANYIGALGPYLGALLFHILGPSLFTLRLGSVILFAAFQLALYFLISLLYTKRFALVSVSLLCLASPNLFSSQLRVTGGALETLLFGTLVVLIASYLVLSYTADPARQTRRIMLYGCLGLVVGLGIWSYIIVVPFVVVALLFVLLYCRRELRLPILLVWFVGLLIGLSPAIAFDISHPSQNLLQANLHVIGSGGTGIITKVVYTFWDQLRGTVLISVPMATGAWPICSINSAPGAWTTEISSCMLPQGLWGCAFLLLWLIATVLALWEAWRRARLAARKASQEDRREARRYAARLLLLGSAGLTMLAFLLSSAPALVPATAPRYLVGLEAVIPSVLWPLWQHVRFTKNSLRVGATAILSVAAILCVAGIFLWGTINAFQQSSVTATVTQQQYQLIDELLRLKDTRIYTDYWTCDRLAFLSDERIICSVVDNGLNPGVNRYAPYVALVQQSHSAVYVFGPDTIQVITLDRQLSEMHRRYRQIIIDGYIVFQLT
jgi:hypothetical protein